MLWFGKPKNLCFRIAITPCYFGDVKKVRKVLLKLLNISKIEKNYLSYSIGDSQVTLFVNKSELSKLTKAENKLGMFTLNHMCHRDRPEGGADRKMK
jgi:hypothetical protein